MYKIIKRERLLMTTKLSNTTNLSRSLTELENLTASIRANAKTTQDEKIVDILTQCQISIKDVLTQELGVVYG
jgi:hypothetical protein